MKTHISQKEWLELPKDIRERLRQTFSIGKSGPVELENGVMVSDGSTQFDLMKLNLGTLIGYLGDRSGIATDGLFDRLLSLVVGKTIDREEAAPAPSLPEEVEEVLRQESEAEVVGKPCCGSRGARHLKNCATLTK